MLYESKQYSFLKIMNKIYINIKNRIFNNEFNKNVLILSGGTIIAQILPIAVSPIITRLYEPIDFGVLALFVSITSIVSVIANGRYELAIMIPEKDNDAINVAAVSVVFNIFIILSFFIIILIFKQSFLKIIKAEHLSFWIYFAPLTVFFSGIFLILSNTNNRFKLYKDISKATILRTVSGSFIQIIMGFLKTGVSGLISGQIVSQTVANIKLFFNIKNTGLLREVNIEKMKKMAIIYKDFPRYSIPAALFDTISIQIPIFMFSILFKSNELVGHYSMANRILTIPFSFIATSIAQVFYQSFSKLKQKPKDQIKLLLSTWKKLGIIGFFPFFIISIYGEIIFSVFLGNKWKEAGKIASILAPMIFTMFISSPTSTAYLTLGMQNIAFYFGLFSFIIRPLSIYIGYYLKSIYIGIFIMVLLEIFQIIIYNVILILKLKIRLRKINL